MQDPRDSNWELESADVFSSANQYFLLIFSMTCILSSAFVHGIFIALSQI